MGVNIEPIINELVPRIVKAVAKHTLIGTYYAAIHEALSRQRPGILSSNKSTEDKVSEVLRVIREASQQKPVIDEETLRRIIREELRKYFSERGST